MRYIAFSLFGNNPLYCMGALKNAAMARSVFPGWKCVFFCASNVPADITRKLRSSGASVRNGDPDIANEMFWRFLIADEPRMERFIVRDTDSRLIERDYKAVCEWEKSGLPFHSVRDHPYHTLPLGGGLWGATKGSITGIKEKIINSRLATKPFVRSTSYGLDQTFLTNYIWPMARGKVMQHDSCTRNIYPDSVPFPDGCKMGDFRFTGEVIDERGNPHPNHWQQRINFMQ